MNRQAICQMRPGNSKRRWRPTQPCYRPMWRWPGSISAWARSPRVKRRKPPSLRSKSRDSGRDWNQGTPVKRQPLTTKCLSWVAGLSIAIVGLPPSYAQSGVFRNTAPGVHYVGTKVCAGCHRDIFESYSKTAMGRSMVKGDDPALRALPVPFTLFDKDAGTYFEISQKEGAYYQSQYAVDRD